MPFRFLKFQPLHLCLPTDGEKDSCLCKTCENALSLRAAINSFPRSQTCIWKPVKEFLDIGLLLQNSYDQQIFQLISSLNLLVKRNFVDIYFNKKKRGLSKLEYRIHTVYVSDRQEICDKFLDYNKLRHDPKRR